MCEIAMMTKLITLPFAAEIVWDIIQNPSSDVYDINAKESLNNLNDKVFVYINNIGIKFRLCVDGCSYEEKCRLFDQYLELNTYMFQEQLTHTVFHIIAEAKGIKCESNAIFTPEEITRYTKDNPDKVDRLVKFFDSTLLYMTYQLVLTKAIEYKDFTAINPVIDDKTYVPINILTIFELDDVASLYGDIQDEDKLVYFKQQFEQPIFNGKYLKDYVYTDHNFAAAFLNAMITDGEPAPEDKKCECETATQATPQ